MFMPLRDWYVLQVINGREKQIAEKLTDAGIRSCVPEREVNIRQRGKWHRETRLFFDGYVFIRCQYSADIYHTVKRIGGVIKILPDAIHPVALHRDEADFIKICSRGVIGLHDIIRNGNQYEIADGELAGFNGRLVMIRPRQRKAILQMNICGNLRLVSIGIDHITEMKKSEAASG